MARPLNHLPSLNRRRTISLAGGALLATRFPMSGTARSTSVASPAGDPRTDLLVDAGWLQDHLADPSLVVVAFMPITEFAARHVPGAIPVHWPELEVIDTSDESIASWGMSVGEILGALGISPASLVVVYDDGTLFAARLWWIMHYLGHPEVRILDGGLAAWREAGGEVETGETQPQATGTYIGRPAPDVLAQLDEVLAALDDPEVAIVDARTPDEFAAGHIPGAVNVNYPLNARLEPPRRFRPPAEMRALYEEHGVTPDRLVIPYCTSGVRSAVTAFTLHLLGYERVALYTGSWQEWSTHPDTPRATGRPVSPRSRTSPHGEE